MNGAVWPVWAVVAACGVLVQLMKLLMYSLARKHLALTAAVQANGLPSLPAALLSCLVVVVTRSAGWESAEAGVALVFAVIVVHDSLKMGWLTDLQREALVRLLDHLEDLDAPARRAAAYLDPRAHHPAHVAAGLVLGGVFALAFGPGPR
ncbi:MAG: divergent PAP2 family protein [Candidatus Krumholzibacteriia bacterium]